MMKSLKLRSVNVLAALCSAFLCVVISCQEREFPPADNTEVPENIVIPTTDLMEVKVTADMPTAVFSNFDENSTGAALVRRLGAKSATVGEDTRMVLIKGSDVATVSDAAVGQMADVLLREGLVAIETPTAKDLLGFIARLIAVQSERQNEYINEYYEFGPEAAPAADAAALQARYDARLNTVRSIATKAGISSLDEVMAEMFIVSNIEYFYQEPGAGEIDMGSTMVDEEGNDIETESKYINISRTPYQCGIMADAAATWLNGIDAQRNKTRALSGSLMTKAGSESLNNLMDASETFSLSSRLNYTYMDGELYWRADGVIHNFRFWSVHNMKTDKDFYYVQQDVLITMGDRKLADGSTWKLFYPLEENKWYKASGFKNYDRWYGNFFSRFITSLDLSGNGSISLEEAAPYTDNSSGYKTVNVGSEQSSTDEIGVTWGGSIGFDPSINFGGEYSWGTTSGSYFEIASTHVDNDIVVAKNTEGTKVTWTYTGSKPTFRDINKDGDHFYEHTTAPKALVNDINFDNQIIWSVKNPSGQYTVNVTSHPYVSALMYKTYDGYYKGTPANCYFETHSRQNNTFSHTLLQPFRATQTWRMYVTVEKMKDGGPAGDAAGKIEERLSKKFPDCYHDVMNLCDHTATSVQVINANVLYAKKVFNNNLDILQQFAEEQGVKKYTIRWRCDNADIRLREGYSVETVD